MTAEYKASMFFHIANQRELASNLEMSLGKLNYCLKALLDKGLVKAENFMVSNNKRGYLYKLTPAGLSEKTAVTMRFLRAKIKEFEDLKSEIQYLKSEAELQGQQSDLNPNSLDLSNE